MSVTSALRIQRAINARRSAWRLGALSTLVAADFLTGGSPTAGEAYDRKGAKIAAFARGGREALIAFRERVREAAHALPGAARVKLGGFARGPSASLLGPPEGVPRGAVTLPDIPPHPSQLEALELIAANRRVALVAGRRWGKTTTARHAGDRCGALGQERRRLLSDLQVSGTAVSSLSSPRLGPCLALRSTACSARSVSRAAAQSISGRSITPRAPAAADDITWR